MRIALLSYRSKTHCGGQGVYVRHLSRARPDLLDDEAMRRWLTVAPVAMRYWEDIGAIRWAG